MRILIIKTASEYIRKLSIAVIVFVHVIAVITAITTAHNTILYLAACIHPIQCIPYHNIMAIHPMRSGFRHFI